MVFILCKIIVLDSNYSWSKVLGWHFHEIEKDMVKRDQCTSVQLEYEMLNTFRDHQNFFNKCKHIFK